ncbi:MAG: SDR family oxidoreductase [Fimbriimonadales bacterium]
MTSSRRPVLITGSSRGIGAAIARSLAKRGWTPLIAFRSSEAEAQAVASETGGIACPFGADLSTEEACRVLWDWASGIGPISALVNNAGVYRPVSFADSSFEDLATNVTHQLETNFLSAVWLAKMFVDQAPRGAKILNVCSRVGFRGEPGAAGYAASKAAEINLVRSLAVELAPKGIGVFGIAPGWVETAMTREGMEARKPEILAGIPLGRVATVEDCGETAAFLLSDEAAYLSGVVVDINGASYFH